MIDCTGIAALKPGSAGLGRRSNISAPAKRRKNRYTPRDNADRLLLSGDGRAGRDWRADELDLLARPRSGGAALDDSQIGWDAALMDVLGEKLG